MNTLFVQMQECIDLYFEKRELLKYLSGFVNLLNLNNNV